MLSEKQDNAGQEQWQQFCPGYPEFLEDLNVCVGSMVMPVALSFMQVCPMQTRTFAIDTEMQVYSTQLHGEQAEAGRDQDGFGETFHGGDYSR